MLRGVLSQVRTSPVQPLNIVNPGAETGDTTGWTATSGSVDVRDSNPAPHTGSWYFTGGSSPVSRIDQSIDLSVFDTAKIDAGNASVEVTWWQTSFAGDDIGRIELYFFEADNFTSTGSDTSADIIAPTVWTERTITAAIPANTRHMTIRIYADRTAGTNNDAYFDDISGVFI